MHIDEEQAHAVDVHIAHVHIMHTHAVHADDMHSVFFKQINSAITTAAVGLTRFFQINSSLSVQLLKLASRWKCTAAQRHEHTVAKKPV